MVLLLYLGLAPLITSKSRIPRWKPLMLPSRYPSPYIPINSHYLLVLFLDGFRSVTLVSELSLDSGRLFSRIFLRST